MIYANPGTTGALVNFKAQYGNYIGGEWVALVNGKIFCNIPRSGKADIELALDKAHQAKVAWDTTSVTARSNILLKIADRIEQNLEMLAVAAVYSGTYLRAFYRANSGAHLTKKTR